MALEKWFLRCEWGDEAIHEEEGRNVGPYLGALIIWGNNDEREKIKVESVLTTRCWVRIIFFFDIAGLDQLNCNRTSFAFCIKENKETDVMITLGFKGTMELLEGC